MSQKIDVITQFILRNFSVITLCVFLFGISVGCFLGYQVYKWRMKEVVSVGGFLFDGKIYDVKERKINFADVK